MVSQLRSCVGEEGCDNSSHVSTEKAIGAATTRAQVSPGALIWSKSYGACGVWVLVADGGDCVEVIQM